MSVRTVAVAVAFSCVLVVASVRAAPRPACLVPELGLALAGPDAVDCGVAASGKRGQRARVAGCARRAIKQGKAVRFGVGEMGIDAFACDVVVHDAQGRFWRVVFNWDMSLPNGGQPSAFVGRCPGIDFDWKDPDRRDRFGPLDCVFDEDAFQRARIRRP